MNLKRREFVRLGGITVAGSMVIPTLLNSCKRIIVSDSVAGYMEHFEVTAEQLQKVLATALEKGADYADLYFEHTVSNSLSLQDNEVNSAYSDITFGVGIRVLKATKQDLLTPKTPRWSQCSEPQKWPRTLPTAHRRGKVRRLLKQLCLRIITYRHLGKTFK